MEEKQEEILLKAKANCSLFFYFLLLVLALHHTECVSQI